MDLNKGKIKKCINNLKFKFPYDVDDWMKNLYLENYHSHKSFSNGIVRADSPTSINEYVDRIKQFNTKCLYSLDHGCQGNWIDVYKTAEINNLKFRHSAEVYWVKDRFDQDRTNAHMVIVSKSNKGKESLNFILSEANASGYYYRPRIDLDLLLSCDPDDFIVTSACIAGWIYDDADEIWLKIAKHFGDNFFFELQPHNTEKQKTLNKHILELANKNNIQIICGLDSHYIYEEDSIKRDQILKYKKISYPDEYGWYMDYPNTKEVIRRFEEQGVLTEEEILTCILNTNIFVNGCDEIVLNKSFKIPNIYPKLTKEERIKLYKNILNKEYKKEKNKSKEKKEGLRWEAEQIIGSDTVDYMLTTKGILDLGVNKYGGTLTTTSRGSAASYCTNKLLGLTTVDRFNAEIPIYPERFITKERILSGQMPDVDSNIGAQEPFVKAARELLGEHGCYPLMAVEVLKEKNAWKLYADVNDISPTDANMVSKYLDDYNKALKHTDDDMKDQVDIRDYIPDKYYDIFMQSKDYQSIDIGLKCHACGFLIFNGDIRKEIGLITAKSETTGEKHLVACVEGKYLDEFGYVKEDFLIVDAVSLTKEFFESIGGDVPTFEELKKMVDGDEKTWEVYEKGIVCCVNQCEKQAVKLKKYKPKNIAELAAFIAGIRPGFASLLNTFLDRQPYSTGEEKIDDLLKDSANFMIYQESIMKVLSFLGLPMTDTYGVIKSISKKKLKGKMKEDLLNKLKSSWINIFGNLDNFNKVWKVIEDSAAYAFNAPHAYSMAGDSLYQAWFKAHHTAKFYKVAIDHYHKKGNKDKIDTLVKEIVKFYGYKLGEYKFGNDNRKIHIDEENKTIYPNLSSIKGIGEQPVIDLYELGKNKYDNFIDLLLDINKSSVNSVVLNILVKLDFFSDFGNPNKLFKIIQIFSSVYDKKIAKKENDMAVVGNKEYKCYIPLSKFRELFAFGGVYIETAKQIKGWDDIKLIKYLADQVDETTRPIEYIKYEYDCLGYVTKKDPDSDHNLYIVIKADVRKKIINTDIYEIYSGKTRSIKQWTSQYERNQYKDGDIIRINKIEKKYKRIPSGEINEKTGKQIWVDDKSSPMEYWLSTYSVEREE